MTRAWTKILLLSIAVLAFAGRAAAAHAFLAPLPRHADSTSQRACSSGRSERGRHAQASRRASSGCEGARSPRPQSMLAKGGA